MMIWELKPKRLNPNPWNPYYDKCLGFVIAANNERNAREMAAAQAGDEGKKVWLDPTYTSCDILNPEKEMVIIRNFMPG